jgi:hypothetical protein
LADNPTVAKNYQAKVSAMQGSGEPTIAGRAINWDSPQEAAAFEISRHNGDRSAAADFYARTFNNKKTEDLIRSGNDLPSVDLPGQLYKVDLPDEHIAKMLDWDKPLSQQHPDVQKALQMIDGDTWHPKGGDYDANELGQSIYQRLTNQGRDAAITSGRNAQTTLGASQAKAAEDLRAFGIPGIRYLDGGSRGAATIYNVGSPKKGFGPYSPFTTLDDAKKQIELLKGHGFHDAEMRIQQQPQTSNFVVFPGNEGLLKILERNGGKP